MRRYEKVIRNNFGHECVLQRNKIMLLTLLAFLKRTILVALSISSILYSSVISPEAHPDKFGQASIPTTFAGVQDLCRRFSDFLNVTEEGREFLTTKFPQGFNFTRPEFIRNNPIDEYKTWYSSLVTKREEEERRRKTAELASEFGVTDHFSSSGNSLGLTPLKNGYQKLQKEKDELQRRLREEEQARITASEKAAALSPIAKSVPLLRQQSTKLQGQLDEAKELLKSSEQRILELEARMGQEAIGAIHGNVAVVELATYRGGAGGRVKLDAIGHLQQSYLDMIDEMGSQKESSVQEDSEIVRKKVVEVTKIFEDIDESRVNEARDQALTLMRAAFDIVSKYEDVKLDVFERKISDATTLETLRKTIVDDIFYDVFLSKMSELELRILNLDVLQQSLDLTKLYQNQLEELIKLNIYSPSKLSSFRQFLTNNENMLGRKIEERDAAIRDEYQPSLITVRTRIDELYAEYQRQGGHMLPLPKKEKEKQEYDFAYIPVPLQLMRSPIAFFLLAKSDFTDKKFNDIQILDQSLIYLTREQTRSFFVYLYDVHTNFSAYKKRYEEITLASPPPLQQKDVQELIKIFKNRLKTYFLDYKSRAGSEGEAGEIAQEQSAEKTAAEKPNFNPAFNDRKAFREFAMLIDDLISGAITTKIIKKELESLRIEFNHKLDRVTIKGIDTVMQSEPTHAQVVEKTLRVIEKFAQLVNQQGGVDAITSASTPQLKELLGEMKTVKKDMNDRTFPFKKLIQSSTDFKEGSKILESVVVITAPPPLVAKVATPIKKPAPPVGRPAMSLGAPLSAENLTTDLDQLAIQLETKKASLDAAKYDDYKTRIQAARDNVTDDALQQAQMKIKKLKTELK